MSTATNPEKAADTPIGKALEFLVFALGQEEYGIDIQKEREFRGCEAATHITNVLDSNARSSRNA